jgi:hypothetical protein
MGVFTINAAMKTFLFSMFVFIAAQLRAQIELYKTYDDYVGNKAITYPDFRSKMIYADNAYLHVKDASGQNVKIDMKSYWGFRYKNQVFRISRNNIPFRLVAGGKICYYENGLAYISALLKDKTTGGYCSMDGKFAFSKTLESPMAVDLLIEDAVMPLHEFFANNPEYNSLFTCLQSYKPDYVQKYKVKADDAHSPAFATMYINTLDFDFVRKCVSDFMNEPVRNVFSMMPEPCSTTRAYYNSKGQRVKPEKIR